MDEFLIDIIKGSPVAGALLLVAHWFKQGADKMAAQMQAERKERDDGLKADLMYLRSRSDECEKDRARISGELNMIKQHVGVKFSLFENRESKNKKEE